MIRIENYKKVFGKKIALKDINVTFEKGNIYGIVGPNGSGKTTLLNSITGFTKGLGVITVNGNAKRDLFLEDISYMPDEEFLVGGSINEMGRVSDILDEKFVKKLFFSYVEKFGIDKKKSYVRLSKGQKMSVKVAYTLSRETPIYVFDEPLSGIDILTRDLIMNEILEKANEESLIIISSHELHDLDSKIDKIVLLNDGEIVEIAALDEMKDEFGKDLTDIYKSKLIED